MSEEEMTQRERRAERARQHRPSPVAGPARKALIGYAVILLVAGGSIAAVIQTQGELPRCPSHWHPSFQVYIDGERVPFSPTGPFGQLGGSVPMHIHGDDGIMHVEPFTNRCIPAEDAFEKLAIRIEGDALTLGSAHGSRAGEYPVDANHTLHVFTRPYQGEWKERSIGAFNDYEPGAGDSLLVTYGNDTAAVEAQKGQVPPPQEPFPAKRFPTVPVIGVSCLAALALVMWRGISKKS